MRSLSSRPRTLLRLISYSVAGYSLVMMNSVTVLGTTELSSRPTKEERKPQVKFSRSHINASVGPVCMGALAALDQEAWMGARIGTQRGGQGNGSWTGDVGSGRGLACRSHPLIF